MRRIDDSQTGNPNAPATRPTQGGPPREAAASAAEEEWTTHLRLAPHARPRAARSMPNFKRRFGPAGSHQNSSARRCGIQRDAIVRSSSPARMSPHQEQSARADIAMEDKSMEPFEDGRLGVCDAGDSIGRSRYARGHPMDLSLNAGNGGEWADFRRSLTAGGSLSRRCLTRG